MSFSVTASQGLIIGSVIIPTYSKGFIVSTGQGGNDATLYAIDSQGNVYIAFRNGTNWQSARKLVAEGSATAIKYTAPLNGGTQIQVARTGSRVYRVSMFRNANTSVALVDQWGAVAYIVNTASFVITADSTNITIKNNSGAYCNVVVEEM